MNRGGGRKVWIDLANSPHVPLFAPIVERLEREGWEVCLTARRHAQTTELAERRWPGTRVIGDASPNGRGAKALVLGRRVWNLFAFARAERPDVALSHGSYAQIVAARLARVRVVSMMDYEHQPANHLSFRLAHRLIVPSVFPEADLRRCGATARRTRRYDGFKEEVYLAGFTPDTEVLGLLGLDPDLVTAVMRPPPEGALYHRSANGWFDELVEVARCRPDVQTVVLPRSRAQAEAYGALPGVIVPAHAVDGQSLLALADIVIGAGGTMNRESALLGTPTYTVFAGKLAAADAALIASGRLHDLRATRQPPAFVKKPPAATMGAPASSGPLLETVSAAIEEVVRRPTSAARVARA